MFTHTKEEIIVGPRVGQWHQLAEDIRMGCLLAPRQMMMDVYDRDDKRAACALGAAMLAAPMRYRGRLPFQPSATPCPAESGHNTIFAVQHLNDVHRWTREQIADWLDTL